MLPNGAAPFLDTAYPAGSRYTTPAPVLLRRRLGIFRNLCPSAVGLNLGKVLASLKISRILEEDRIWIKNDLRMDGEERKNNGKR